MMRDETSVCSLPTYLRHAANDVIQEDSPRSAPADMEAYHDPIDLQGDIVILYRADDDTVESSFAACAYSFPADEKSLPPFHQLSQREADQRVPKELKAHNKELLSLQNIVSEGTISETSTPTTSSVMPHEMSDRWHCDLLDTDFSTRIANEPRTVVVPPTTPADDDHECKTRAIANLTRQGDLTPTESSMEGDRYLQPTQITNLEGEGFTFDESIVSDPSAFIRLRKRTTGQSFETPASEADHTYDQETPSSSGDQTRLRPRDVSGTPDLQQPNLQDPTGFLLMVDRMMECFDGQPAVLEVLNSSPHTFDTRTLDSLYDEAQVEAELENDCSDWELPCWNDGGLGLNDKFDDFDESVLDETDDQEELHSSGSLFDTDSLSTFEGLEFEPSAEKAIADQTMTTDGESSLSLDLHGFH